MILYFVILFEDILYCLIVSSAYTLYYICMVV